MNLAVPTTMPLQKALEDYLAARDDRNQAFSRLAGQLREAVEAGAVDEAAAILRRVVSPTLDYTGAQTLLRIFKKLKGRVKSPHSIRLAVLGSFTTKQLVALIELQLFAAGIDAEVYEGEYGVFRQEILDPTSQLHAFKPQVVFLATARRDLGRRPGLGATAAEVAQLVAAERDEWASLWQAAYQSIGCQVIQNNFVAPAWRSFGNHEGRQPGSLGRFVEQMNRALTDAAPPHVVVHDVDHLAAAWGRWQWDDSRFFHQAKLPCAPECLVDYAHSVASLVIAQRGLSRKCAVLDLDNTLWGGVIGDDGLGGIRLGQGNAEGEAYLEFQAYLKTLRERGILLAVCSKNRHETAAEVFEKHPEMILRASDIACFVANWDDKASNLKAIAKTLNIGLDSLVFIDDNPAERLIVRQNVPQVAVPELPEDVAGYVRAIEQHRYFQVLAVASEDLVRTEYYKADALRREVQTAAAGDITAYLRSLDMVAQVGPITPLTLERSAQLIQRSNQFNLTTRRYLPAELTAMAQDPAWITRTISLADRFGDNGLISVVLARSAGDVLEIDTWLMSCRVLKRGVEQMVLNHFYRLAHAAGHKAIRGVYIPTPKNELVREHYATLGFTQVGQGEGGRTEWQLSIDGAEPPQVHFIQENPVYGNATK